MLDKAQRAGKLLKFQSAVKKELEKTYASGEKREFKVTVRGDKRIEKVVINGEENKVLKDLINDVMKKVEKKGEKKTRGLRGGLGIPGLE